MIKICDNVWAMEAYMYVHVILNRTADFLLVLPHILEWISPVTVSSAF